MENKYADMIHLLKKAPRVSPPDNFTPALMARINDSLPAGKDYLAFGNLFAERVTHRDCAFHFFATGFFYLIMGLFLLKGLKGGLDGRGVFYGINMLPAFTVITAGLLLSGAVMLLKGRHALRIVRACLFGYFLMSAAMGFSLSTAAPLSRGGVIFLAYVGISAAMGVILAISTGRLEQGA